MILLSSSGKYTISVTNRDSKAYSRRVSFYERWQSIVLRNSPRHDAKELFANEDDCSLIPKSTDSWSGNSRHSKMQLKMSTTLEITLRSNQQTDRKIVKCNNTKSMMNIVSQLAFVMHLREQDSLPYFHPTVL